MSDHETTAWDGGPAFGEFLARAGKELLPKIAETAAVISIAPAHGPDVKFGVETGLAVAFDKPIILLVRPGTKVGRKLAMISDEIVEVDFGNPDAVPAAVDRALDRLAARGLLK